MTLDDVLAVRPTPGEPRAYRFPDFERTVLPSGMQVLSVRIPGRPLVSASLIVRRGAGDEPAELGGATVLAARAMTEGSERHPGLELVEAAERLGATLSVDAGWDALVGSVEVPARRLAAALELLAETVERPAFEARDIERLRDERLNDLLQVDADPRRRVEKLFAEIVYVPASPYSRPAAGRKETVENLDGDAVRRVHRGLIGPASTALVVGGDISPADVLDALGASGAGSIDPSVSGAGASGTSGGRVARPPAPPVDAGAVDRRIVRFYDRPGSVQTELRIGHVGVARRVPDFHAVQVMSAILGGLFNSRLQMNLREDKGYTYGVNAGFDMRRGAGPFAVRTAVHTEATVASIRESLAELRRMRDTEVTPAELAAARDYLVGVFPLRFETPGAVVGALGGLYVQDLPDDELARYRERVEAVTAADVRTAAEKHIDLDRLAIVAVGNAGAVRAELEAAGFGELEILADEASGDSDDSGEANETPGSAEATAAEATE